MRCLRVHFCRPLQRFPYYATRAGLVGSWIQQNNALQASVLPKTASSSGVTLKIFDVYSLFNDIIDNPTGYLGKGAKGVNTFCSTSSGNCDSPSQYFLWNALHPSQATDQILAAKVAAFLGLGYKNPLSSGGKY